MSNLHKFVLYNLQKVLNDFYYLSPKKIFIYPIGVKISGFLYTFVLTISNQYEQ